MRQHPILMYHWFRADPAAPPSRSPQLEISPQRFEEQIRYLKTHGYSGISLGRALEEESGLPPKPVVLTFDDGTLDFWQYARPVLAECGFTATLFVVTGYVGGTSSWDEHLDEPPRTLLSWEQLAELQERGFEIGSHTHSHRVFTELDIEEVRSELSRSRQALADRLGKPPEFFAYPRGFYRPEHKKLVREAGYRGACGVILGWRDLLYADAFELKRMTVKGTESLARFKARLWLAARVPFSAQMRA